LVAREGRERILLAAVSVLEMNTGCLFRPEEDIKMKTLLVLVLCVGFLSFPVAFAQNAGTAEGPKAAPSAAVPICAKCAAANAAPRETPESASRIIPGTNETMVVGSIENLVPIGVLTVLGCEKCSAEAVNWALQQGSSFDDIERTLRTVTAMQKLDCFKSQFGPEVATRMEKPLAAAKEALEAARTRAAK
jgi:hypothetical protein